MLSFLPVHVIVALHMWEWVELVIVVVVHVWVLIMVVELAIVIVVDGLRVVVLYWLMVWLRRCLLDWFFWRRCWGRRWCLFLVFCLLLLRLFD